MLCYDKGMSRAQNIDVAIIGAGSAGLSARRVVAKHTDNYRIFDAGVLGTTCARVGCMPSKVLIQSANDFHRRHVFAQEGILNQDQLSIDVTKTFEHVRTLRDRFVRGVMSGMEAWKDTHLIQSYVGFVDAHTLRTTQGDLYKAKQIIIATGSAPQCPEVLKPYQDMVVDTDTFFELESIPKRWAVIGTGVIGMELGQALHRLGLEVTLIGRSRSMAGMSDPELREYTIGKMKDELSLVYGGIQSIEKHDHRMMIHTQDKTVTADRVLLAAGRKPNLEGLGLEKIGIKLNKRKLPDYNLQTMQIQGFDHLYIAGDNNGDKMILHEASDEGRIAGYNATHNPTQKFMRRTPLGITFTDPNIAFAGMTYRELKEQKIDFVTGKVIFEGQGRSIVKLKEKGALHIYASKEKRTILGAEMFGPDAEHISHMIAWAIGAGWTVDQALAQPFYHPVIQEGLRTALRSISLRHHEIEIPKVF